MEGLVLLRARQYRGKGRSDEDEFRAIRGNRSKRQENDVVQVSSILTVGDGKVKDEEVMLPSKPLTLCGNAGL